MTTGCAAVWMKRRSFHGWSREPERGGRRAEECCGPDMGLSLIWCASGMRRTESGFQWEEAGRTPDRKSLRTQGRGDFLRRGALPLSSRQRSKLASTGGDSLKCVRCSFLFQRALVFCPKGVSCREGTRRALADWGARKTRLDGLRMRAGRRFGKGKCRLEIGAREARARKERECRGFRAASAGVMRESHCRRCLPYPLPPAGENCSGSAGTGEGRNRHGRNSALLRAESSHGPARWERQIFSAECGLACLLNASTWPAAISSFFLWA